MRKWKLNYPLTIQPADIYYTYTKKMVLSKQFDRRKMKQIIKIYNNAGVWQFDDFEKDVEGEPFVEGSSDIISMLIQKLKISTDKPVLTFSDSNFKGYQEQLIWIDSKENKTWNLYKSKVVNMEGWLCPVLVITTGRAGGLISALKGHGTGCS